MSRHEELPYRLNLVKDEPVVRDERWEISITNIGDFGFVGKLLVVHRLHDSYDTWPDAIQEHSCALKCYDFEYETTFESVNKAVRAAVAFLRQYGAGEVEWLEMDLDSRKYVVVQHTPRNRMRDGNWDNKPDPVSPYIEVKK